MPLPDLNAFCIRIEVSDRLCVTFPGGATICAGFPSITPPDPTEITQALLAQVNTALMPLVPIFDIIDCIVALVNCMKAVEDALGPPPDPSKIAKCFPELAKKLAALLKLIPQISIPVMIGTFLDVLINYLVGFRTQLLMIIRKQLKLLQASLKANALGSVALHTVVDCATLNLDAFLQNMNANAAPLARMVLLLNTLLELSGSSTRIPTIANLGQDATQAVAPLDAVIVEITTLRAGFP